VLNLMFDLHWEETKPIFGIEACWSGDHAEGEQWLKPLRAFGKPAFDNVAPMPYVKIQSKDDALYPHGGHYYLKNGFVTKLTNDGIDHILDAFRRTPRQFAMFADHCGGAYSRVPVDSTAFPRRDMAFVLALFAGWQNPAESDEWIAKARATWQELAPLTSGFYTNYAAADTKLAGFHENYGANFERLVALKSKYDPMNLFRLNANVPPKA
jgi:FAD/FMN-containing dehydrogenase